MACPYTRLFVVCTNTVYVILFLVLVAVAFTVHFLKIPNALALYKGSVITDINDVILATGLGDADYYGDRDLVLFLSSFLLVIFIAGLVLLVVAFTGCYAGCCKYSAISKLPLPLKYAVVLILMLVVEFMLVIAVYGFPNSLVMGSIKSTMTSFLTSRYEGLVGNSTETFGWNFIMSKTVVDRRLSLSLVIINFSGYQCCGVYGYNDFKGTNHWKSNVVAKGNLYTLKIPIVCCDQLPTSGNLTCAEATTGINANKGCFEELWNVSLGSPPVAILALGVGLILQLSLIFAAFNLSDKDKKGRVEPHLDKWNK